MVAAFPYLLVIAGLLMGQSDPMNISAGIAGALVVMAGLFFRIAAKSSLGTAIAASFLLAFAGLGVALVVLALLFGRRGTKPAAQRQPA